MQRGDGIGRIREPRIPALSQRLPGLLRPASSGPLRFWQDRRRLAAKGALAASAAWALAKYTAGQADPYFAPIAALFGVYPTVARSFREVLAYVPGFLLGAGGGGFGGYRAKAVHRRDSSRDPGRNARQQLAPSGRPERAGYVHGFVSVTAWWQPAVALPDSPGRGRWYRRSDWARGGGIRERPSHGRCHVRTRR